VVVGKTPVIAYNGSDPTFKAVSNGDTITAFSRSVTNNSTDTGGIPSGTEARNLGTIVLGHDPASAAEVTQVFTKIHNTIAAGNVANFVLGDYVRLSSLNVAGATHNSVTFTGANVTSDEAFYSGTRLELVLVAKDPYIGKNGNTQHHMVFQFKNLPLSSVHNSMNSTDTTTGGYRDCAMRQWIINQWKTALVSAGVPESVLFAPNRMVSTGTSTTAVLQDKVYLPTEWEMFGSRSYAATAENDSSQSHLPYYDGSTKRLKYYNNSGDSYYYWEASVYSSTDFCNVSGYATASHTIASNKNGVAPCFCVA
jgi:hypothetical protein